MKREEKEMKRKKQRILGYNIKKGEAQPREYDQVGITIDDHPGRGYSLLSVLLHLFRVVAAS